MTTKTVSSENKQAIESMEELQQSSLLWGGNSAYLDQLYESYLAGNQDIPENLKKYFDELLTEKNNEIAHAPIKEFFKELVKTNNRTVVLGNKQNFQSQESIEQVHKQLSVNSLIEAYRRFGHRHANLDPLGLVKRDERSVLKPSFHGLTESDLSNEFIVCGFMPEGTAKLADIIAVMENIYCNKVGYQYKYINDIEELNWLEHRIEGNQGAFDYLPEFKKNILQQLTAAEGLEKYLHTKYVGQKRFSLEGGESLIALMDELIQRGGTNGYKEMVLAMAHRGRLNVLVNTLGKSPSELFAEFEGTAKSDLMSGDVKYHQGFSSDIQTKGGDVHLALAFNPSHLEIVSPVAQGSVKARQERRGDEQNNEVLLVSIHGDSAFAGQGVVMETFNMSQLRGFGTGGTVHIVINNQVGFTTSNIKDTRSTRYCTDVAKMLEVPVFHVNADDPEAVLWVTQIALDYKQKFKKDVVIDLICYRRHGHNEADEPSATQPLMYKVIKALPTTRALYAQKLIEQGVITEQEDQDFVELYRQKLDQGDVVVANVIDNQQSAKGTQWQKYLNQICDEPFNSGLDKLKLVELATKINTLPEDLVLQTQVKRVMQTRLKMIEGEQPLDWGCAEMLAYATLIDEGHSLRLCGQDSGRGTFAHRHAILHDQVTGQSYSPLAHLNPNSKCTIIDSFLSEEAVLAYEYGYSTTNPNTLNIWEAQFGDFANGAQVVIDQFISSGEHKWGRLSGLVLLLPHGYEGMGPEHSSARLERFLQLCADHNMQVCVPTTPAQIFHMLRRQVLRHYRKPLVVMSPKSLLRHKLAVSSLDELAHGHFQLVLPETNANITAEKVDKVVLCSGKVYYDLLSERDNNNINNVAIIRIEQLYPFPSEQLKEILAGYNNAKRVVWCQEEPKNQGAWYCTAHNIQTCLSSDQTLEFAGRDSSSSPAVGYSSLHIEQQNTLVKQAIY